MDYRAEMTRNEFDAIPDYPDYPLDGVWEAVIDGNNHNLYELPWAHLTRGQRLLLALGSFDSQVCNGGITQFFWNRPQQIGDIEEALRELNETELHSLFTRAVETVIGKQADWAKLRKEAYRTPDAPDWEPFRQSYDLLDLGWFEKAYFDRRDYNERKEWIVVAEGLQSPFLRRLAAWVKVHPEEFITDVGS
jgi:hypothetical protein